MRIKLTNASSRVTTDLHSGGGYTNTDRIRLHAFELAFVNFILSRTLDNGVMKSPKCREIISLVFACLCITKSLLIRKLIMFFFICYVRMQLISRNDHCANIA